METTYMETQAMKNIFKVTALACLMAATSSAFAGPSANVQVKGTVTQGACVPTLSNGGVVDLGNIVPAQFPASGPYNLDAKNMNLTITCSSPIFVLFNIKDNRADSRSVNAKDGDQPTYIAGLGKTSAGTNIGNYNFYVRSVSGGDAIYYSQTQSAWLKQLPNDMVVVNDPAHNNAGNAITFAYSGSLTPKAISTEVFSMSFAPSISSDVKNVTTEETIDGNATFTLTY